MNLALLSNADISGGAAIAANRLHKGLCAEGVDSQMLVRRKSSRDPTVKSLLSQRTLLERLTSRLRPNRFQHQMSAYSKTKSNTLEAFSSDQPDNALRLERPLVDADIVNLHSVSWMLNYGRFFKRLAPQMPFVWTLHDMNSFTGGCHYSLGCDKFEVACGACHLLGSDQTNDLSSKILKRKVNSLRKLNEQTSVIISPSEWLANQAKKSALFRSYDVEVVPNGLDTSTFKPRNRREARAMFELPADHFIVLFVADASNNPRKGFDLLQAAITGVSASRPISLASVGDHQHSFESMSSFALGEINDERLMSLAYAAADLFVLPTRADNLPNVALEALATGTPIVGFEVGGVPDMVRPGETGLLAKAENVNELRLAIEQLLEDDDLRLRMSENCRSVAVEEYDQRVQAQRYIRKFEQLIETSKHLGSNFT